MKSWQRNEVSNFSGCSTGRAIKKNVCLVNRHQEYEVLVGNVRKALF